MEDKDEPQQPTADPIGTRPRRRRRTALVTSRWAASAAVIAAMTVGAGATTPDDGPEQLDVTTAYADPPDAD